MDTSSTIVLVWIFLQHLPWRRHCAHFFTWVTSVKLRYHPLKEVASCLLSMHEEIVSLIRQETIPDDKLTNGGTRLMLGSKYVPLAIMQ